MLGSNVHKLIFDFLSEQDQSIVSVEVFAVIAIRRKAKSSNLYRISVVFVCRINNKTRTSNLEAEWLCKVAKKNSI